MRNVNAVDSRRPLRCISQSYGANVGTTKEGHVSFPESVQRLARQRARGTCECTASWCPHYGHCRLPAKEFHHKKALGAGGDEELANCQYLCTTCHQRAHHTSGELGRI
jgi:5-methylcytosine-specific restriction endonuclease McrA